MSVLALTAIVLKAYTLDQQSWQANLDAGTCTLQFKPGGTSQLEAERCTRLRDLMKKAESDARKDGFSKVAAPVDEYRYEFVFGGKTIPVAFQAPEVCTIRKGGELECQKQRLSPLQKILLEIRAIRNGSGNVPRK